jgi:hypothetical protein
VVDCVRLLPDKLLTTYDEGSSPDSEVLSVVTHRTNLPNSWRHIAPETVMRHRLRVQLSASIAKARASSLSQKEYVELLEEADNELRQKDKDLASLREDIEERDAGKQIEMLKHLRIGVKDSAAETLRIHFHWDAKDQRIVIGHCGKHLDF